MFNGGKEEWSRQHKKEKDVTFLGDITLEQDMTDHQTQERPTATQDINNGSPPLRMVFQCSKNLKKRIRELSPWAFLSVTATAASKERPICFFFV